MVERAPPLDSGPSSDQRVSPDAEPRVSDAHHYAAPVFSERLRKVRVISGLIMLTYVFVHLFNHALGVWSLDLMEAAQPYTVKIFRSWPGTIVLCGAFLTHFGLALWSLHLKRRFVMPAWEATQMVLGFSIPFLLVQHVIAVRISFDMFATDVAYSYIVWAMGQDPWIYGTQTALLLVAWVHGCIGIHYWLRIRSWYPRAAGPLFIVALVLPLLALVGFLQAIHDVDRLDADPVWHKAFLANALIPVAKDNGLLAELQLYTFASLGLIGLGVVAARIGRRLVERRRGIVQLRFPGARVVSVAPGPTILEISRGAGLPHASVCGGRCRCSTCRVRIGHGWDRLPAPRPDEARVLARIGAAPNVRLACQVRPTFNLEVTPLFPTPPDMEQVRRVTDYHQGREIEIVVMFADLRGFTTASEHRLPYDTVFLLNRYFKEMGEAITSSGGLVDKFIGDGIMALFGLEEDIVRGATAALRAGREMSRRLAILNEELAHDLAEPLKIGIGIHCGVAIVGEIGFGRARALTAIGDVVNTASRIEGLTKRFNCELLVSAELARVVGASLEGFLTAQVDVRGRRDAINVMVVPFARDLKIIDALD